jgi:MarR family transcriptional regulator, transcriptional regulator for hemolysin
VDVTRIPGRPGPPRDEPIGIVVGRTGKEVERAFDDALATAGGSRPTWLIVLAVKTGAGRTQARLASRVGVSGPTLTHHLDRLEAAGTLVRTRDPGNRREYRITLTAAGEALFLRLREAAVAFDRKLRAGLSSAESSELRRLLAVLHDNVAVPARPQPLEL